MKKRGTSLFSLEAFNCLCALSSFKVKGKKADEDDFGYGYDANPEEAEPYGCGDRTFERYDYDSEKAVACRKKYKLNRGEWDEICSELENSLSFGHCGWCI